MEVASYMGREGIYRIGIIGMGGWGCGGDGDEGYVGWDGGRHGGVRIEDGVSRVSLLIKCLNVRTLIVGVE